MLLVILQTTSAQGFGRRVEFAQHRIRCEWIYIFNYLTHVLTRNSFPWFVSGSLHRTALTIFTLDNVWFQALGEDGFLRNALLALSPLINDLGHVAWDINTISVVIKKGAHQQYYAAFALSVSLTLSLPHSPTLPLFEPRSSEEIIQKALAWSETWKRETYEIKFSLFALLFFHFLSFVT